MRVLGTVLSKFYAEWKGFDHNNNLLLLHNCVCKQKGNLRIQYKIKHKVNKNMEDPHLILVDHILFLLENITWQG